MNEISMPVVALRGLTILPEMVVHFDVSRECSINAVNAAMEEEGQKLFLTAQKDPEIDMPEAEDLHKIGCVAVIKQIIKLPKNILRVLVAGECRAEFTEFEMTDPYYRAIICELPDENQLSDLVAVQADNPKIQGMCRSLQELYNNFIMWHPKYPRDMVKQISEYRDLHKLVDAVAANVPLHYTDLQDILEERDLMERYDLLSYKLVHEIQVMNIKEEIQNKVKERVDKHQRDYILREQLKLIREELGEESTVSDADEFKEKAEKLNAPEEVKEKLLKEISRFRSSMNSPAENGVIRTYIETMLEMPWDTMSEDCHDIVRAREILDRDHYGLEQVKERVLEFLAVRALAEKGNSPILCLVGPPGTGKTSIARSLATALDKKYVRISLGGVRDEAEIRGHRKTYVGAMPGRIANGLKTAGVKNPLMLLDEIDKVSNDYKGDTFSALLEVLDSEQNNKFRDHYLEVPLDLSEVFFVTTANTLQTIPGPLLDRMEVIEISSYTDNEKVHIAVEHLIPKQLKRHGIKSEQLTISKGAVEKIVRNYTREAGVRQLERKVGEICRKSAREILEDKKNRIRVTETNLHKYLGKEKYQYQMANETDEVGIVRGLAWTSVGGVTLQIEVNVRPGKGQITLTGKLGDVMKESARTGISYIRSIGEGYGLEEDYFEKHDIHIHIPEGAVPKDGPSAGITMATAILSAVTGRKVHADVAMTGEITLRGRVLPIGGVKEKLLAAKNAGIQKVLVPVENERDVKELSTEITRGLEIVPVSRMEEVLEHALVKGETE